MITKTTKEGVIRFASLGGLEEIGRNMMFLECGDEIIVIDAGLQFPEETTPGIDYIIPNISYLEKKKKNVKALIITHGHLDHIGAIPYIMDKIGNPTIYTASLTKEIIAKRNEEFPKSPKLDFEIVKGGETRQISKNFSVRFLALLIISPKELA
ncbi:MAG: MBL fold metallo-hydrolase [Patescibacteria group bacterium]